PAPVLVTRLLAVGCCWMTALGPATESSTYTLLAPSLAAALVAAWADPEAWTSRRVLVIGYGLFVVVMLARLFPPGWRTPAPAPLLMVGQRTTDGRTRRRPRTAGPRRTARRRPRRPVRPARPGPVPDRPDAARRRRPRGRRRAGHLPRPGPLRRAARRRGQRP